MTAPSIALGTPLNRIARNPMLPFWIGGALLVVSTVLGIVRQSQLSEDAAHSPIIMAIAAWLLVRSWRELPPSRTRGSFTLVLLLLLPILALHVVARWLEWMTIASYATWLAVIVAAYAMVGRETLARLWFPIAYMLLALPLPRGTTVLLTQDLRIWLSDMAVSLLDQLGYPVARHGITIFVDHYELLVQEACSGLNSMISLTAIGLFYAYVRHGANLRYMLVFTALMIVAAAAANLIRVLILILITYHFGNAAAQSFVHDLAGLLLFGLGIALMLGLDRLLRPLSARLSVA